MKRIPLISLLLLAVIFTVSADRRRMLMTRSVATGGACSTVHVQNSNAEASKPNIGDAVGTYYAGLGQYNPGANISVCKVDFILNKYSGTLVGKTFNCVIYAMSGNNFTGAVLGTSDNVAGVDWVDQSVTFTFASPVAINNGGSYAIALTMNTTDASNFGEFSASASDPISGSYFSWNSAGTQVGFSTADPRITIYK